MRTKQKNKNNNNNNAEAGRQGGSFPTIRRLCSCYRVVEEETQKHRFWEQSISRSLGLQDRCVPPIGFCWNFDVLKHVWNPHSNLFNISVRKCAPK